MPCRSPLNLFEKLRCAPPRRAQLSPPIRPCQVRRLGVGAERIIYAHCCKMPKHLQMAAAAGIQLTTFDTEAELYKARADPALLSCSLLCPLSPAHKDPLASLPLAR